MPPLHQKHQSLLLAEAVVNRGLAILMLSDKKKDAAMRKRCEELASVNTSFFSIIFAMFLSKRIFK